MVTRSLSRVGAIAVLPLLSITGCAPATLGVSPDVLLSTVIANLPRPDAPSRGGRTTHRIPASPAPSSTAASLLRTADAYVGVKYVWGGNTPSQGFDCSGFTKYIFAKYRIGLPRTSREQARVGTRVARDFGALRPGDLMFFAEPGEAVSHVAIYVGNGRIIHSSSSVGGVGYTDLNTGGEWFYQYFVAARRMM
jgi:cell wall-associated NlpC family hydrolase